MAKTKQTPERIAAIIQALEAGMTRRAAAAHAGIHHSQFYRWLDADATLRDDIEKAESKAESRFLLRIAEAATKGTWQAAAWWLERRHPKDYALKNRVEMSGPEGGPIRTVADGLNDQEKRALRDAIQRELAERDTDPTPA